MYRAAVVALSPDRPNDGLIAYAVDMARTYGLRLRGLVVLDMDRVAPRQAVPLGASAFKVERDKELAARAQQNLDRAVADFLSRCRAANVPCEATGAADHLAAGIARAAQECDMLLVGHHRDAGVSPGSPLHYILKGCPRPAIVVPDACSLGDGAVVVAYDGSIQAARALEAYVASGFLADRRTQVVSFHADEGLARQWSDAAGKYLRSHRYRVETAAGAPHGSIADAILQSVDRHAAPLLVMGAYGKPSIREFFLGSETLAILRDIHVPVFLDH
jgi:nucleotide-binding universal stress UspA family protein